LEDSIFRTDECICFCDHLTMQRVSTLMSVLNSAADGLNYLCSPFIIYLERLSWKTPFLIFDFTVVLRKKIRVQNLCGSWDPKGKKKKKGKTRTDSKFIVAGPDEKMWNLIAIVGSCIKAEPLCTHLIIPMICCILIWRVEPFLHVYTLLNNN